MIKKIILASQSPRRSEILKKAHYDFVSFPTHVSEIPDKNLNIQEQIIEIARRKAKACLELLATTQPDQGLPSFDLKSDLVLSADTMVCFQDQMLGKPESEQMAYDYLKLLSGKTHQVKTAVYLIDLETTRETSLIETTNVHFKNLTDDEILKYIKTKEPMDKAGAYGIQGMGGNLVSSYDGDFNNVVGLPLHALENLFKINQWTLKRLD